MLAAIDRKYIKDKLENIDEVGVFIMAANLLILLATNKVQ